MAAALSALKKSALIDLKKGSLDKAVEKLQKLVRISVKSGSEEAISTVPLWLLLGEAYKQKGNYQSAIRVFESIIEISENVPARLQLIELYRLVGKLGNSVETARSLKNGDSCPENLNQFFFLNYTHSLILYAKKVSTFDEQLGLIEEAFPLIILLLETCESIMLQKTLAIAFGILQKMDPAIFADVCRKLNLSSIGISNRLELMEKRVNALTTILNKNLLFSDSWNDLALCLMEMGNADGSYFDKAEQLFKKAILLPSSPQKRSNYWFNFGILQANRLRLSHASHCFIRAVQLNENNAKAWFALSLIYKKSEKHQDAFHALQNAQQIDPDVVVEL